MPRVCSSLVDDRDCLTDSHADDGASQLNLGRFASCQHPAWKSSPVTEMSCQKSPLLSEMHPVIEVFCDRIAVPQRCHVRGTLSQKCPVTEVSECMGVGMCRVLWEKGSTSDWGTGCTGVLTLVRCPVAGVTSHRNVLSL